jgi:hypothetical protein
LTLSNTPSFLTSVQLIFFPSSSSTTFQNFPGVSGLLLVTVCTKKWFWGEEGHCWHLTWWWLYAWTKAHNLFTFSHQFQIHYFCLWLQSQKQQKHLFFFPTQICVHHNYYSITASSHNEHTQKTIHILFRPLRQRALLCLGMKYDHPAHTFSWLDHPTYHCQSL